jgi:hypothetical protein
MLYLAWTQKKLVAYIFHTNACLPPSHTHHTRSFFANFLKSTTLSKSLSPINPCSICSLVRALSHGSRTSQYAGATLYLMRSCDDSVWILCNRAGKRGDFASARSGLVRGWTAKMIALVFGSLRNASVSTRIRQHIVQEEQGGQRRSLYNGKWKVGIKTYVGQFVRSSRLGQRSLFDLREGKQYYAKRAACHRQLPMMTARTTPMEPSFSMP